MKQIKFIAFPLLFAGISITACAQSGASTETVLRKIADRIIAQTNFSFINPQTHETYDNLKNVAPSAGIQLASQYTDWHYTNGVLNMAMLDLSDTLRDPKYRDFVNKYFSFVFNSDNLNYFRKEYDSVLHTPNGLEKVTHVPWYMFFRMIRLDDYGTMAGSLIQEYKLHPDPAYKNYIDKAAYTILNIEPQLKDGTIARYFPHQMTIWGDDLYMSVALLARLGYLTGDKKYFNMAVHQVIMFHHYLWDSVKHLYYHCYYVDSQHHGVAYWGRANGWIMMAQADLLTYLPENDPNRKILLDLFRQQVEGISRYQGPNGLWHQLLDKTDSYVETSCSAMFTFCIARGVNRGWIEPDYAQVAAYGWKGILSKITPDGDVTDICPGTGIAPSTVVYYNRPLEKNTPMGEGPVLRAGTEILHMQPYREIPASATYHLVHDRNKK